MEQRFPVKITVLGSGTSTGVPVIGCTCPVCQSEDPHDQRLRPSVLLTLGGAGEERQILIDTTPDLRLQALRAGLNRLDAVLYTHSHADHIMGLDDLRPYNYGRRDRIPVYGQPETIQALRRVFPYAFNEVDTHAGGVPRLRDVVLTGEAVDLFGQAFLPVLLRHGPMDVLGFRFGRAAYLTDHSDIPEASFESLRGLDVLFLDALRHEPHPMHSTVEQALAWVEELKPKRAFFTHISCRLGHQATNETLPANVQLAYDGLELEVPATPDV